MTSGQPLRQIAAVRLGAAGDVGAVSLNDEGELHRAGGSERRLQRLAGGAAFSMASSCTQANSTSFTRRCRSKLSRLYSNSQRSIGIITRRLTKMKSDADAGAAMRLVAHRRLQPPGLAIAEQLRKQQGFAVAGAVADCRRRSTSAKSPGSLKRA